MRSVSKEIAALFAEETRGQAMRSADGVYRQAGSPADYLPPWRMRLADGSLSKEEYGDLDEYRAQLADYRSRTRSWSPWDDRRVKDVNLQDKEKKDKEAALQRPDMEAVVKYVARHAHKMAARELECFLHFWVEMKTREQTARLMGVAVSSVIEWIKRIRTKVKQSPGNKTAS